MTILIHSIRTLSTPMVTVVLLSMIGCSQLDFVGDDPPAEQPAQVENTSKQTVSTEKTDAEGPALPDDNKPAEVTTTPTAVEAVEESAEAEPVVAPAPDVVRLAPEPIFVTQTFDLAFEPSQTPVDILFLVDNSFSMNHEIQKVNQNLTQLLTNLSDVSHLRVGVLSAFNDQGNFDNDAEFTPFSLNTPPSIVQINHRVRSWNSLVLAKLFALNDDSMARDVGSSGVNFFRPDAIKVFVVVSDDNSNELNAQDFYTALTSTNPELFTQDNTRFYGFVGVTADMESMADDGTPIVYQTTEDNQYSECQVYESGRVYHDLVMNYFKGAVFDICQDDWSYSFAVITDNLLAEIKQSYPLNHNSSYVTEILLGSQSIDLDQVILSQSILQFKSNLLAAGETGKVTVIFKLEKSAEDSQKE
ncbi:MAG: VWA domain-containing protein [Proteobacteria bacterium]|nr:VWA domain-containing protein [Pseudomonadota bacterium]